jgi:cyclopropane fatty-acyl-phospholipid synthase-like methyltransferase
MKDAAYIFDLLQYNNARILHTAVGLGVFEALSARQLPAAAVSRKLHTDRRATEMLLNALVALQLLRKRGELYALTPLSRRYLLAGSEDYIGNIVMHGSNNWENWGRLEEAVRTGKPVKKRKPRRRDPAKHRDFILAMHDSSRRKAKAIAEKLRLRKAASLLDVGGGPGTYSVYFCLEHPRLRASVYDFAETLPITDEITCRYGVEERVSCIAGDFTKDPIPGTFDVVWCSNIIHSYEPAENRRLLKKLHRATSPGGQILIQDFVLNKDRTSPIFAARFALNMLINTDSGATYSYPEIREWLENAGYTKATMLRISLPNDVKIIRAWKAL